MLTREENELLTRTGAGTPMGELLRRYWLPAVLSSELPERDCPPIRVRILGEKLVAFRDTEGRVGLLDEFCAHRRASLFLGRNEECGLRCVYHGWKYDVEGNCTDMPNEPPESNFKEKIHLKTYPTLELAGVIWAYLGPKEKVPPPPNFEWTQAPQRDRMVKKTWQECNWLQALEGNFDTTHVAFLHRKVNSQSSRGGVGSTGLHLRTSLAPKLEVEVTDYGFYYAATRAMGDKNYVHVNHYVMPCHQMRANTTEGAMINTLIEGHMVVPMDEENCMDWVWRYNLAEDSPVSVEEIENMRGRAASEFTADFRKIRNKGNNWMIDRQVQKNETFTGIDGINIQDHAVQESMGPIVDRTQENLVASDTAIYGLRRLLTLGAKAVQNGDDPPGLKPSYYAIRPTAKILPAQAQWRDELKDDLHLASPSA